MFLTQLAMSDGKHAKVVMKELEREVEEEREAALDALARRLSQDNDPRDEQMLSDLRQLAYAFRSQETWPDQMHTGSAIEILAGFERLFDACIRSLERSLILAETLHKIGTPAARAPIVDERERVLAEIAKSIEKISKIFTHVQALRTSSSAERELIDIRQELDSSLAVAARVEERMRDWDQAQGHRELEG